MSKLFADLSNNNPAFNAPAYRSAGHQLIVLKATEGLGYTDDRHAARADAAHHAGLLVGHYHFCRPDSHPEGTGEAAAFWAAVKPHWRPGDLLILDIETPPRGGMAHAGAYLQQVDTHLSRISGQNAVGYTYTAYMAEAGASLQVASRLWWMAAYGSRVPLLGHHRRRWAHQYTDGWTAGKRTAFAGIGICDASRLTWRGLRDLKARRARARGK